MKANYNLIVRLAGVLAMALFVNIHNIALAADKADPGTEPGSVPANADETDAEFWQDQSVQDVLEHDIRQALRNSQEKNTNNLPQSILAPRLVALYGVGKALMAEVQVGNQAYLYIRGQPYPAGYLGDTRVYQLKAMNGACIQLEKGHDKHSLCLRMLLGESLL